MGNASRILAIAIVFCLTSLAWVPYTAQSQDNLGQDSRPYDGKLLRLSEILGAVHYLRELCGANEGQLWREKMMQILIENAGAQKSMLIENIDDRLLIQAEGTADGVSGILQRLPVEESGNVPLSVINYVARSEKKLVFDNLSKDPNYSSDDYIQKHQPKSVVCFPIIRKESHIISIH